VLHDQLRAARIRAGLSQVQLARRAGIQRSRLRIFEEGGNITLETLAKLLEQLPDVRTLDFGGVEIRVPRSDQRDLRDVREAMADFAAGAQKMAEEIAAGVRKMAADGERVIELLDRLLGEPVEVSLPVPEPAPDAARPAPLHTGPVGATLYEAEITDERAEELQKIDDRMRREEELEEIQRRRAKAGVRPRKTKDQ